MFQLSYFQNFIFGKKHALDAWSWYGFMIMLSLLLFPLSLIYFLLALYWLILLLFCSVLANTWLAAMLVLAYIIEITQVDKIIWSKCYWGMGTCFRAVFRCWFQKCYPFFLVTSSFSKKACRLFFDLLPSEVLGVLKTRKVDLLVLNGLHNRIQRLKLCRVGYINACTCLFLSTFSGFSVFLIFPLFFLQRNIPKNLKTWKSRKEKTCTCIDIP